jgi:hypothetical protein
VQVIEGGINRVKIPLHHRFAAASVGFSMLRLRALIASIRGNAELMAKSRFA